MAQIFPIGSRHFWLLNGIISDCAIIMLLNLTLATHLVAKVNRTEASMGTLALCFCWVLWSEV